MSFLLNDAELFNLQSDLYDLPLEDLAAIAKRTEWIGQARPKQLAPDHEDWDGILWLAGRGFGKTKCLSEAGWWLGYKNANWRIAVIAPTSSDVRDTCFEGESGLLASTPPELIENYNKSLFEMVLKNGTIFKGFSSESPERLRGPQHHAVLCDEVAAWVRPQDTWDMMQFGLRLGTRPKILMATTPKPKKIIRDLVNNPRIMKVMGTTYENRKNLAPSFFTAIAQYEGTAIGRQELYGELLDLEEGGIFKRKDFRLWPSNKDLPEFLYVVQSYDTAFTDKTINDQTACTTWGVFEHGPERQLNVLLCDAWADRLTFPDLRAKAKEEAIAEYGDPPRRPDILLIEDKGSGISLCQELHRAGVPVRPYNPGRADKAQRAHAVSHFPVNGRVWIPESKRRPGMFCDWATPFLDQICVFNGDDSVLEHDDYVDSFTQALALLRDQRWLTIDPPEPEPEPRQPRENPYGV